MIFKCNIYIYVIISWMVSTWQTWPACASTVAVGDVAPLRHEARDDPGPHT